MSYLNRSNTTSNIEVPKVKLVFPTQASAKKHLVGDMLNILLPERGIVFDYMPLITTTHSASYQPVEITHSNYDYRAYNKSTIHEIQLSVVFTATTREEADKLMACLHFLRTFTKMNFGINDAERGMPPQVFRLSAYGDYAFNRVPVAIQSANLPWSNDVDMVSTSFNTFVPSYMEGSIILLVMPTPNKVRTEFSLDGFARGDTVKKGYI